MTPHPRSTRTRLAIALSLAAALSYGCSDGRDAARRRLSDREAPAGPRYGPDSSRRSPSTHPALADTAPPPVLEVLARRATIVVIDEGGRRTNSVLVPEDAVLEEIPASYGYTDGDEGVASSERATVGVPGRPGARYRVEVASLAGGRDSATVTMAVGGGPVLRVHTVPFEVAAGGRARFEVIIGAEDYRVTDASAVRTP